MNKRKTATEFNHFVAVSFLLSTIDPYVFIEEEYKGYVRYRNITSGRRWEVLGICDYRGDCIVGAVNPVLGPRGGRLDVPVTPEFRDCCPFIYQELPNVGDI